jgi:outer membrane protein OmpA-like peptidoglycan-associated protein
MRNILIGLTILLWLALGWIYMRQKDSCCNAPAVTSTSSAMEPAFTFNWNESKPLFLKKWPGMRDSIALLVDATHHLEIAGFTCSEEVDSVGYERAKKLRETFTELPDSVITLLTREVLCDSTHMSLPFEGAEFNIRLRSKQIQEVDNKTYIYFPSNSTQKLNSNDIEAYLDNVAKRVITSSEQIILTGNTDDQGDANANTKLGQGRANIIRDYLISKGVSKDKITAKSAGESDPIDTNKTAEGRQKNRRTELQITQ